MTLADGLDYAAVFVFALTGGLVASRAQLDPIGFYFIASVTAVGGGTVRDLILGRGPVFWVENPGNLAVAGVAAILVFFTAHLLESRYKTLVWLDALALAVAVSAGVSVARDGGATWIISLVMGVITGTVGGLMRDVICNEMPFVLNRGELYVTAAFAGALANLVFFGLTGSSWIALCLCVIVTFCLRAGSILFGWCMPTYKSRPPKVKR